MPSQAGESTLVIVFADIHYFLSPPTYNPLHHRFEKASYLYLYQNAQNKGRVEIANNAGTPDQDALSGSLDFVQIAFNYKQPTLITITIDQAAAAGSSSDPAQQVPEWQLPSYDPKNETKYLYKLHTVDIYFWTVTDAALFLTSSQRLVPIDRVQILNAPASTIDSTSPIVQKLEQAAIANTYESKLDTTSSGTATQPTPHMPLSAASYRPSGPIASDAEPSRPSAPGPQAAAEFVPISYNPAAPAAPEPMKPREKTPPPPDDVNDTSLMATSAATQTTPASIQYVPSYLQQQQQQQTYFPGQPQPQPQMSLPGAPQRQSSFPGPVQQVTIAETPPDLSSFSPPPPPPNTAALSPPAIGGASPYQTPTLPATTLSAFSPPPIQQQPTPPIGGYSTYGYNTATGGSAQIPSAYEIHNQAYRPMAGESHGLPHGGGAGPGQAPGKLEQQAGKLEKGVNSFLKKLDKKW